MNKTDNTLGRAYTSPVCRCMELSIERCYLTGSEFGSAGDAGSKGNLLGGGGEEDF